MQPLTDQAVPNNANIMIVDDNPANLRLLEDMLRQRGHEVHAFPLGRLALAAASRNPPDLILLDINMPEMNGYEVCERLKSSGEVSAVPVIFLSALNETRDKMMAFRYGAVDYISKPFQFEEVHARVETHLELYNLQRALRAQNENLEAAVASRTRELARANERLKLLDGSKDDFLRLISHEFRTPLNGLLGVSDLILAEITPTPEHDGLRILFERCRARITSLLDDALLFTQIGVAGDGVETASVLAAIALDRAIEMTAGFAESREVSFTRVGDGCGPVQGTEELLSRALHSLLMTAVRFSTKGGAVRVFSGYTGGSPAIVLETSGRTIPPRALPKFFDLFSIGEAILPGGDLGIAAPLASRILALTGASVTAENRETSGIRLTVSLRKRDAEQANGER